MIEQVESEILNIVASIGDDNITALYQKLPAGKRLRAKLLLKIAQNEEAVKVAAIVELIHAASLLHDDVIDDADSRRGVKSINAIYGNKHAIMLGDILYSKAYFELTKCEVKVAQAVSDAVTKLSIGELEDVELAKQFNFDEALYMDMIYKKTAILIEASAKVGAILAKKEEYDYATYGKNLGLAFQIVDDILDITSDSKTLGKPALNDFVEGKCTLPYIYLYEKLDQEGKKKLVSFHGKPLDSQQQKWIKQQMQHHKAIEKSFNQAQRLIEEAVHKMHDKGEEYLVDIAKQMIEREY
ncbi:MAG: polyprenyl synthetase family protein [Campylobacterota bacterium]